MYRAPSLSVFLVTVFCTSFGTSAANAAIVTINTNLVRTVVADYNGPGPSDIDSYGGTAIPTTNYLLQSNGASPDQFAKVLLNYAAAGGTTALHHQFNLSRQGSLMDYSQTYDSTLRFTVDSNTGYNASGNMLVDDNGLSSGRVYFHSYLRDLTTNTILFESQTHSQSTTDEFFTLGSLDGDLVNFQQGTLSGTLIAGHQYAWYSNAQIYAYPDPDNGATATGFFSLTVGAIVPEPSSILTLTGLGLSFAAGGWRRRRVKAAG
jgi:hypothetical protein